MKKPHRNPVWSRDELILALDFYVKTGGNPISADFDAVDRLSDTLNKMHRLNGVIGSGTLRNGNGVYLKVMNFRRFDPAYLDQGKVGMQRGNRLEGVLWAEYEGRQADLAADAETIRQAVIGADEEALAKLPPVEPYEGEEGGVIMRLHKRYERDAKLVREKRKAAAATGKQACEVCGFDSKAAYSDLGDGSIEPIIRSRSIPLQQIQRRSSITSRPYVSTFILCPQRAGLFAFKGNTALDKEYNIGHI